MPNYNYGFVLERKYLSTAQHHRAVTLADPLWLITVPLNSHTPDNKLFILCTKFWRAGTALSGRMQQITSTLWNSDSFSDQGAGNLEMWGSASSKTVFHSSLFCSKWIRIPYREGCTLVIGLPADSVSKIWKINITHLH